jgi:hypothetical protein
VYSISVDVATELRGPEIGLLERLKDIVLTILPFMRDSGTSPSGLPARRKLISPEAAEQVSSMDLFSGPLVDQRVGHFA